MNSEFNQMDIINSRHKDCWRPILIVEHNGLDRMVRVGTMEAKASITVIWNLSQLKAERLHFVSINLTI